MKLLSTEALREALQKLLKRMTPTMENDPAVDLAQARSELEAALAASEPRRDKHLGSYYCPVCEQEISPEDIEKVNEKAATLAEPRQEGTFDMRDHEPELITIPGPVFTAGLGGSYTVAFLGCRCGWNSDGEDSKKETWSAHVIRAAGKAAAPPADHLKHIQRWLTEMYQTMVDPVEEFNGNIEQLCALLLKRARQDREALNGEPDRETLKAAPATASLSACLQKFLDACMELDAIGELDSRFPGELMDEANALLRQPAGTKQQDG